VTMIASYRREYNVPVCVGFENFVDSHPVYITFSAAAAEHGLRIMAMLYLTPILPLGPVSYMCGTTSMALSSFVMAKIASLPLMLLYAFIGASTGALLGRGGKASQEELQKIEENQYLILSGIGLSLVMISCITHYIKKELNTVRRRIAWACVSWQSLLPILLKLTSFCFL
jgi:uncharacterized membrane protein YdjX (TVP38/TMEM64 family)